MTEIIIGKKSEEVTYEQLAELIKHAHITNEQKGLIYSTQKLTATQIYDKINRFNGTCFVATINEKLVGTASICIRKLNYWYYSGNVAVIHLVGVDPDYRGLNIASNLFSECINWSSEKEIDIIVSDTAEENEVMRKLYTKFGFLLTDFCFYPENNFNSVVYVKWLSGCPYDDDFRNNMYRKKRNEIIRKQGY